MFSPNFKAWIVLTAGVATTLSIVLSTTSVRAQWYSYNANVNIMLKSQYTTAMNMNLLTLKTVQGQHKAGAIQSGQSGGSVVLGFRPSAKIASLTRRRYLEHLTKQDPAAAREYEEVLASQDVHGKFRANLAAYGLDSNNIGDVMSAYWITLWAIANNRSTEQISKSSIVAVQREVRGALARNSSLTGSSEKERQIVADLMMYDTVLADASYSNATKWQRQDLLQELSESVHRRILAQGLDLRSVDLTRKGFVKR